MKPVVFSKKSLHWRLATVYGCLDEWCYEKDYRGDDVGNICGYIRSVGMGFLVCILIVLLSVLMLSPMVDFIAWVLASIMTRSSSIPASGYLLIGYMIIGFLIYKKSRPSRKFRETNSFMKAAFRKFHDKTCFIVKVE